MSRLTGLGVVENWLKIASAGLLDKSVKGVVHN